MSRTFGAIALAALAALPPASPASAQLCDRDSIAAVIDETGATLRKLNADGQAEINPKLRVLATKRGWRQTEIEVRGYEYLRNEEIRALDAMAGQLLIELDRLGDEGRTKASDCDRLVEAKAAAARLIEVTRKRAARVSARLDAVLQAPAKPAPSIASPGPPPPPTSPLPTEAWETRTKREQASAAPGADPLAELPRFADPGELAFTTEEIQAAGRGFFGTLSAELASVIGYAFKAYGRPTGYVLGTEGGAAFLAGLRYGTGTLVTKELGRRKIYWQGPSVGTDLGLDGSRVMFLVYNIEALDQLFTRFAGVDGSAYLVGGVGITFLKKGRLVLAPIRTGLGLRLGANVGYLKFTPEPSLNPF